MNNGSSGSGFFGRRRDRNRASEPNSDIVSLATSESHSSPPPLGGSGQQHSEPNIFDTDYARKRKELMALANDLRAMGAETLIQLPQIAVIGGQSTGKSSLVEAISGIKVPRDSGTCTRCPMECTLNSNVTSWSCQISLRFDYDENGTLLSIPIRSPFGHKITDKTEVEIWLRRAQAAILSNNASGNLFVDQSREELRDAVTNDPTMAQFSKNVVCVDISDPEATDLSFIDLPGLIQNNAPDLIDLVRDLVVSYIAKEKTIILVTIPASDDIENQQAVQLARAADPDGERTIGEDLFRIPFASFAYSKIILTGILTKPDSLTRGATGARQTWIGVLQGEVYKLKHGYYCVRLPDDEERARGITPRQAQQLAKDFFDTTAPWSEISDRSRLGIPGLVSYVSQLLVRFIEEDLPKLRLSVEAELARCDADLSHLPPALTSEPSNEILDRISKFCKHLRDAVYGEGKNKGMVHRNRASYELFKKSIRRTAPEFRPFTNHLEYARSSDPQSEIDDDGDTHGQYEVMDLQDVRQVIKEHTAWELPHNVPYDAKKALITTFINLWQDPTETCFNAVFAVLCDVVDNSLVEHFGQFKKLEACMSLLTFKEIETCKARASRSVEETLDSERNPFYTQNTDDFESVRQRWLDHYRIVRRNQSQYLIRDLEDHSTPIACGRSYASGVEYSGAEQQVLQLLRQLGYDNLTRQDLHRLHPPDNFEDELLVMADVRSYFQVAYKRIIDYVPLTIEHSLNQVMAEGLQKRLVEKMNIGGNDSSERLGSLLDEDPAVSSLRDRLQTLKARLVQIQAKLSSFRV